MSLKKVLLVSLLFIISGTSCGRVDYEPPECGVMREIGQSSLKSGVIRDWINATLADPGALAKLGPSKGPLLAMLFDLGLDWALLGIPADDGVVEFYGESVDYRNLDRESVDVVIIGHGYAYKLLFKLNPDSDIEDKLTDESKRPYGAIQIERLGPEITLVCQKGHFG